MTVGTRKYSALADVEAVAVGVIRPEAGLTTWRSDDRQR
jgi:hypothetical protein